MVAPPPVDAMVTVSPFANQLPDEAYAAVAVPPLRVSVTVCGAWLLVAVAPAGLFTATAVFSGNENVVAVNAVIWNDWPSYSVWPVPFSLIVCP